MRKQMKDVTFSEFVNWANNRACDGDWDLQTAITCTELIGDIYKQTRHAIFRRKKQEELFKYYKLIDFNPYAVIDVD